MQSRKASALGTERKARTDTESLHAPPSLGSLQNNSPAESEKTRHREGEKSALRWRRRQGLYIGILIPQSGSEPSLHSSQTLKSLQRRASPSSEMWTRMSILSSTVSLTANHSEEITWIL